MSSYWRVIPTFRLARHLCRETYGSTAPHLFFRHRYLDRVFRAWPWAAHSELRKTFDDIYKKHWEDFDKVVNDSFGVRIKWDRDANNTEARAGSTGPATSTHGQAKPSSAGADALVSKPAQDFEVALDLRGFNPEEISVKIAGNTLRVEAKHEKTDDGSHVLRSYTREFVLPADVDLDALKSSLNAEGMLSLTAPGRGVPERSIPIDVAAERDAPETAGDAENEGVHASPPAEETPSAAEKPEDSK